MKEGEGDCEAGVMETGKRGERNKEKRGETSESRKCRFDFLVGFSFDI